MAGVAGIPVVGVRGFGIPIVGVRGFGIPVVGVRGFPTCCAGGVGGCMPCMAGVAPGTVGVAGANGFGVNGAALAPKAPAGVVGTCWEKAAAGVRGICLGSGGVRGIISALGTETLPLTSFSQSLSCHCFLVFHEEYSDLSSHLACFELDVSSHPSHSLFTRFLPCQSLLSFCHHLLPPCHLYQSSFSLPLLSCQSS